MAKRQRRANKRTGSVQYSTASATYRLVRLYCVSTTKAPSIVGQSAASRPDEAHRCALSSHPRVYRRRFHRRRPCSHGAASHRRAHQRFGMRAMRRSDRHARHTRHVPTRGACWNGVEHDRRACSDRAVTKGCQADLADAQIELALVD